MAMKLTAEAKEKIRTDGKLFGDLCDMFDVKPTGLISILQRDSERLTRHDVVLAIAKKMGTEPKDILEEKQEAATV